MTFLRACFILSIAISSINLQAGIFSLGAMVGVNSSINQFFTYGPVQSTDSKLGYNANLYSRIRIGKFLLQPELGYIKNRAEIRFLENNQPVEANYSLGNSFGTVLLGIKFSKIRFLAGPTFTSYTDQGFDQLTSTNSILNQINDGTIQLGGMFNLGLDISKKWCVDARIYRTFSQSDFKADIESQSFQFSGNTGTVSISIGYTFIGAN